MSRPRRSKPGSAIRSFRLAALTAILNALVGLNFLARRGNHYALTPESASFLVSTKPTYHGGFFQHMTQQVMPNWMQLKEAVRTGRPAITGNHEAAGAEFFARVRRGALPYQLPG